MKMGCVLNNVSVLEISFKPLQHMEDAILGRVIFFQRTDAYAMVSAFVKYIWYLTKILEQKLQDR